MALNTWWDDDRGQRYWMEVATTGHMGELLIAPKFPGASWSYALVSQVRVGDRVLHWQADGPSGRGLVGWSAATADPEVTSGYRWKPRGASGRKKGTDRVTDAWTVDLGGFNPLPRPLTSERLRARLDDVLGELADLEGQHGKPIYFPFYLYAQNQLRAQQGYLMKFPVGLFDLFPELTTARLIESQEERFPGSLEGPPDASHDEGYVTEEDMSGNRAPRGRTTRVQDPILRSAIETHAVDAAITYYRSIGGTDFVKLGKPYDIKLSLDGVERHVEVKGSSVLIDTVELTINEVTHAQTYAASDLVVVDGIDWTRHDDGSVETDGGRLRVWTDWVPAESALAPRRFAYTLPHSGDV